MATRFDRVVPTKTLTAKPKTVVSVGMPGAANAQRVSPSAMVEKRARADITSALGEGLVPAVERPVEEHRLSPVPAEC